MKELNDLVALAEKADNLCLLMRNVNPHTILAIAEAFRAMEQEVQKNLEGALAWQKRAEAAEAKLAEVGQQKSQWVSWAKEGCAEADRLKAKLAELAELEKQEPEYERFDCGGCGFETLVNWGDNAACPKCHHKPMRKTDLFTRPAPAVSLAELVPDEWTNEQCLEFLSIAFRHAEISGDIEMDDIRLAVKMVNAAAPEVE